MAWRAGVWRRSIGCSRSEADSEDEVELELKLGLSIRVEEFGRASEDGVDGKRAVIGIVET